MGILHENPDDVQCEAGVIPIPAPGDAEWLAALGGPEPEPAEHTDSAWLAGEIHRYAHLPRSATQVEVIAADTLKDLTASMRFYGHTGAAAYAADPNVPVGPSDLAVLRLPDPAFTAPLARALEYEASWYLHLDTDAGRLAAWQLLFVAAQADEFGSETAVGHWVSKAAWAEAMSEAAGEAGVEW
jgi:hypothetical protein